jgi:hypothetical protein
VFEGDRPRPLVLPEGESTRGRMVLYF